MQLRGSNAQLAKLLDSHPQIGQSARGPVAGFIKNDEFRSFSEELADGSIIIPPDQTPQAVTTMLQRRGSDPAEIERSREKIAGIRERENEDVVNPYTALQGTMEGGQDAFASLFLGRQRSAVAVNTHM